MTQTFWDKRKNVRVNSWKYLTSVHRQTYTSVRSWTRWWNTNSKWRTNYNLNCIANLEVRVTRDIWTSTNTTTHKMPSMANNFVIMLHTGTDPQGGRQIRVGIRNYIKNASRTTNTWFSKNIVTLKGIIVQHWIYVENKLRSQNYDCIILQASLGRVTCKSFYRWINLAIRHKVERLMEFEEFRLSMVTINTLAVSMVLKGDSECLSI